MSPCPARRPYRRHELVETRKAGSLTKPNPVLKIRPGVEFRPPWRMKFTETPPPKKRKSHACRVARLSKECVVCLTGVFFGPTPLFNELLDLASFVAVLLGLHHRTVDGFAKRVFGVS